MEENTSNSMPEPVTIVHAGMVVLVVVVLVVVVVVVVVFVVVNNVVFSLAEED